MIFTSSEDMSFELRVIGYQFPAEQIADYDSNWLNIRIDVRHSLGHWSRTDPALLTYEVQRLAEWFIALAAGDRAQTQRSFLEPNLSFELVGDDTEKLRISFRLEFSPPWTQGGHGEERPYVEFPLGGINLEAAAASLLEELSRFPQRASR